MNIIDDQHGEILSKKKTETKSFVFHVHLEIIGEGILWISRGISWAENVRWSSDLEKQSRFFVFFSLDMIISLIIIWSIVRKYEYSSSLVDCVIFVSDYFSLSALDNINFFLPFLFFFFPSRLLIWKIRRYFALSTWRSIDHLTKLISSSLSLCLFLLHICQPWNIQYTFIYRRISRSSLLSSHNLFFHLCTLPLSLPLCVSLVHPIFLFLRSSWQVMIYISPQTST